MKLETEFYKLPIRFEAARLAEEVLQFGEEEWRAHPQKFAGNSAIPLVSVGGGLNDDVRGPMQPTPFLARCPYLRQVVAALGTVVGRTRLMRIAGESDAHAHVDANYYWRHHVRVHIPAVTYPEVRFVCGRHAVNMAAGEAWIFDSWKLHNVINPKTTPRIHLVMDTVGNAHFWDELVARSERPFAARKARPARARLVKYRPGAAASFALEAENQPVVMTPWEQEGLAARMFADLPAGAGALALVLREQTRALHRDWLGLWTEHGDSRAGWPAFHARIAAYEALLQKLKPSFRLKNGVAIAEALRQAIVFPALAPEMAPAPLVVPRDQVAPVVALTPDPFAQPVFIVAAPRSGSTMLFELLARAPAFVTVGGESHHLIEGLKKLHPSAQGYASNRLTAKDADPKTSEALRARFLKELRHADGSPLAEGTPVCFLEKTPKNALRIPFLRAVFPGARFIYLYRDPHENVSSILEAWRSGQFVTYPKLPRWKGPKWSLSLIPGWRELAGRPLAEIAACQWTAVNAQILADLESLPPETWCAVRYADVVADPQTVAARLCEFAGVPWTEVIASPLPPSRHTLTPPEPEKWRRNEQEMAPFLPLTEKVAQAAEALEKLQTPAPAIVEPTSVHTTNFPGLLRDLGLSLLVSTYQAGRLIVLREQEGALNTHFRSFISPMGIAYDGTRLALGVKNEVCLFVNQPDVAPKLPPAGTHDAAFLPRGTHHTGDIRVHEIAYVGDELWAVNTRFSCLCTLGGDYSFAPRWRPPFVSALAAEDRCHLNGFAVTEAGVQYVTCLGRTDTAGGWRAGKAHGGCVLHYPSGEVVGAGLSMPHSPRLYGGHLWLLESGRGALSRLDPATGRAEVVASMPGFTRGLDFFGPFAFVGLSQVRESAVFSDLPLTRDLAVHQRTCGVWVIDLRTGQTVAFLRFDTGVQEIFAVQVLAGVRHPDLVTEDESVLSSSFIIPDAALAEVAPPAPPPSPPKKRGKSSRRG